MMPIAPRYRKNPLQGDDLTKRPRQFFRAIAALREELQKVDPEMIIQFWHTSAPEIGNPKGLDDLINAATNATEFENLMEDFTEFKSGKTRYFQKFNITSSLEKLRDHFAIGKGKAAAEAFFRRHAERIGDETPFNHLGTVYRWDPEKTELVLVTPKWAQDLIWVGDNFFRLVDVPRAHELGAVASIKEMVNVKPTTLTALYGKNYRKFLIDRYYTGFVNIPGHFNYQQQIDRNGNIFYNKYFPFAHHDIRQGNWPYIEKLLRHIFGADPLPGGITTYDMALDYFQILLLYPTERLPVFAAFSPENTTGKSTLANLVIQIFGDNAVSVNAAEFQDKFNDSISSRLLVICDETLIDNDAGMDRLKNLVTAKQVLVNPKGLAKYTIDHFAKYWMFSNRPNMLKVVKYDERFWFRRISAIPKGDQIPDMEQLMASEIPAFLHFLRNRKLVTTKKPPVV
ncbi:MAG: hypothetical protein IPI11_17755 [Haliscomenobacter sp.]|nr:hypothetical protein [Haliscomenobacter sp.]